MYFVADLMHIVSSKVLQSDRDSQKWGEKDRERREVKKKVQNPKLEYIIKKKKVYINIY